MRALWMIFLFMLLPIKVWAGAIQTSTEDVQVSGVIQSAQCGEDTAISGVVHWRYKWAQVGQQNNFEYWTDYRDMVVTGLSTGIKYPVSGQGHGRYSFESDTGELRQQVEEELVKVDGIYRIKFTFVTMMQDGQVQVGFAKVQYSDCR